MTLYEPGLKDMIIRYPKEWEQRTQKQRTQYTKDPKVHRTQNKVYYKGPKITKDPIYKRPKITKDPIYKRPKVTKDPILKGPNFKKDPIVLERTNLSKATKF